MKKEKKFKKSELIIVEGWYYDSLERECMRIKIKNKKTGKVYLGYITKR